MNIGLANRHFLTLLDYSADEIRKLIDLSVKLKKEKKSGTEVQYLKGKNIALIFEKTSTRTRCSFEVAAYDQGAHVTYLEPLSAQIGHKESIKDTARVLGRLYDAIEYRGYEQRRVELLAEYSGVPVWNGLTNEDHPTQVLGDIMTMMEHCDKPLKEISFCYCGDARNNVGNALLIGASKLGMDFRAAAPPQCLPDEVLVKKCREIAKQTGARITLASDVEEAVKGTDFLYTDVWVSMGEPESLWEERIKSLLPYQVNKKMFELTENKNVKLLHCLPAFHNRDTAVGEKIYKQFGLESMEVTDDVFESEASVVFDQAENRMHTIKAIMVATLS